MRGHRRLAEAYASHVLDIYDHFSWRYMVQNGGQKRERISALKLRSPTSGRARYFDDDGKIKVAQLRFRLNTLPAS